MICLRLFLDFVALSFIFLPVPIIHIYLTPKNALFSSTLNFCVYAIWPTLKKSFHSFPFLFSCKYQSIINHYVFMVGVHNDAWSCLFDSQKKLFQDEQVCTFNNKNNTLLSRMMRPIEVTSCLRRVSMRENM